MSGRIHLDVRAIDFGAVVTEAIGVLEPAAHARNIRFGSACEAAGPTPIMGDARRLQQAVWNVLSNAIKFTPAGGHVAVRLSTAGSEAALEIADTGEGIDPERLPQVFERFRQGTGTATRGHGGLGLGLNIARHLVELHGGTISAASAGRGQGATFTITLPLVHVPVDDGMREEEMRIAPLANRHLDGVTVLVVEDEPDTRELLALLLEWSGARVMSVDSTRAALASLRERRPDVVISDIAMRGADGYALIRAMRRLPSVPPVIALTAYGHADDPERILREGFDIYLSKPVEPTAVLEAVARLAGRVTREQSQSEPGSALP
jgi:CheY-like chemotaxis protein